MKKKIEGQDVIILTPEQEFFCKLFTTPGFTFKHNTFSYAEAYDYVLPQKEDGTVDINSSEYKACKANGARLMWVPGIREQIQKNLLENFNEKTADSRLQEIIIEGKDGDSIQAIKIFNDLKQRITKKVDVNVTARPLAGLSDEELEALANE